jgi:Bax protein
LVEMETSPRALRRWRLEVPVLALASLVGDCGAPPEIEAVRIGPPELRLGSAAELENYFSSLGYTREALRAGADEIPRVRIAAYPRGWSHGANTSRKKSLFFRTLLPLVLEVNERILASRERLIALLEESPPSEPLSRSTGHWLGALGARYELWGPDRAAQLDRLTPYERGELLLRVDAVPVSLALGQAAYESGYASSRAAFEANALFGQWHWGRGLRPARPREALGDYRIASFGSPLAAVEAYAFNLNTHRAYREFRQLRACQRSGGAAELDGLELAGAMTRYAESGDDYVETLRGLIRRNRLRRYDGLRLAGGEPVRLVPEWSGPPPQPPVAARLPSEARNASARSTDSSTENPERVGT